MSRVKPSFWLFLINKIYIPNLYLLPWLIFIFIYAMLLLSSNSSPARPYVPLIIFSTSTLFFSAIGIRFFLERKKFQELKSIFASGAEVNGEVVTIYFSRGYGYVTYEYQYQQQQHRSTESVNQNRKTKELAIGQKVMLYVNQQKPSQAIIRDLYINTF